MPPRVRDARLPGLLREWLRTAAGWHGRVVSPALEMSRWIVVVSIAEPKALLCR